MAIDLGKFIPAVSDTPSQKKTGIDLTNFLPIVPDVPIATTETPAPQPSGSVLGQVWNGIKSTTGNIVDNIGKFASDTKNFFTNPQPDNPLLINNLWKNTYDYEMDLGKSINPLLTSQSARDQMTKNAGKAILDNVNQNVENFADATDVFSKPNQASKQSAMQTLSDLGNAGLAGVNLLLTPVSAAFAAAEKIPFLKPAADQMNFVLSNLGKAVAFPIKGFVQALPDSVFSTPDVKSNVADTMGNIGSLGAQIILGSKLMDSAGKGEVIDEAKVSDLADEVKSQTEPLKTDISTAENAKIDVAKFIPKNEASPADTELKPIPEQPKQPTGLPTIEPMTIRPDTKITDLKEQIGQLQEVLDNDPMKKLAKYESRAYPGTLPEVTGETGKGIWKQTGDQIAKELMAINGREEMSVNDIANEYEKYAKARSNLKDLQISLKAAKGETFTGYTDEQIAKINEIAQNASNSVKETTQKLEPIAGTGEIKTLGLSKSVEASAVKEKLTKGFGYLPEYRTVEMAQQAKMALDLVNENYDRAKDIAMGNEPAPKGLIPEKVFEAVKNRAIKEGDITTINDLATNSTLPTEAKTMGQRIKALDSGDNGTDPVKKIQELKEAKDNSVDRKSVDKLKKSAKAETEKVNLSKEDLSWDKFLDKIQC